MLDVAHEPSEGHFQTTDREQQVHGPGDQGLRDPMLPAHGDCGVDR
jgi:hypothetical protein